jgi:hypothetical protein
MVIHLQLLQAKEIMVQREYQVDQIHLAEEAAAQGQPQQIVMVVMVIVV